MPYITQKSRKIIDSYLYSLFKIIDGCEVGDLNYIITKIIHKWIKETDLAYRNINAAIGILECAKLELYRIIAAPYEDKKKLENGNISELDHIQETTKYKCNNCEHIFNKPETIIGSGDYWNLCPKCKSENYEKI